MSVPLSGREKEVVSLLLQGHSYRRISEKLFISLATVKSHVNNIYKKTDTRSKIQLYNLLLKNEEERTGNARAE
jgi:DNA-binding CsgD family transcriptional regulator